MKLFVDDLRAPPEGYEIARTYNEAILMLESGCVKVVSLDHDLGENKNTGYDICKYIIEHSIYPETIIIHTANPVGRANMAQLLERYMPTTIRLIY